MKNPYKRINGYDYDEKDGWKKHEPHWDTAATPSLFHSLGERRFRPGCFPNHVFAHKNPPYELAAAA
jgi:hypothetical protein